MDNTSIGGMNTSLNNTAALIIGFRLSYIGYILADILLIIFIGVGNILVIMAFTRFQTLRTVTNVFVINLSVSDLLLAIVVLPMHIAMFIFPVLEQNKFICLARYFSIILSAGTSGYLLLFISIDRLIIICWPLRYDRIMTQGRITAIVVWTWSYGLAFASIPFFGVNNWSPSVGCTFTDTYDHVYIISLLVQMMAILIVILVIYCRLFATATREAKIIYNQQKSVRANMDPSSQVETKRFLNKKAAKTFALVVGLFAVCMMPFFIATTIDIVYLRLYNARPAWVNALRIVGTLMTTFNSGMNPIIYQRRVPGFKRAFDKILRRQNSMNYNSN